MDEVYGSYHVTRENQETTLHRVFSDHMVREAEVI